jgi:hypothetical protein
MNKTGNEIIAEWMGLIRKEPGEYNEVSYWHADSSDKRKRVFAGYIHQLKYATSWDWLMPVVEKIEKIEGVTTTLKNKRFVIKYGKKTFSCHTVVKINSTYRVVVEFLDWYTKNKNHE